MRLESDYKPKLIKRIRERLPGCVILKNDANYMQGVPDLIILWNDRWAMLEVKRRKPRSSSDYEPNQEWYIDELNRMSFCACVYPGNEEEVLDEIQRQFQTRRKARVSQR
jgi:hypothetical protein